MESQRNHRRSLAAEALNNIISQASASRASVVIPWQHSKILLLIIKVEGCGFGYSAVRKDVDRCLGLIRYGGKDRSAGRNSQNRVHAL
jgi:glucose-6-phosphate-specific signal transduction histidine kinase